MSPQFVLSALTRATLQSKLKTTNQRIVQIKKTFGDKSPIYKEALGILEKGGAQKFLDISASGNVKIGMRKITNALKDPGGLSEVNEVLAKVAGIKINTDGSISDLPRQGVKTVKEIRKQIKKRLEGMGEDPNDYTQDEQVSIYEEILQFSQNFETAYEAAIANAGEQAIRNDPITRRLYSEYRRSDRRLTYRELEEIKNRLDLLRAEAKAGALSFENANKEDL